MKEFVVRRVQPAGANTPVVSIPRDWGIEPGKYVRITRLGPGRVLIERARIEVVD